MVETIKIFNVALSTEKPPHSQVTILSSTTGMTLAELVITIAPQKLI
jgi:hypothetical protein